MFKLVLEKAQEPEIKLPTSAGSSKKQESSRKKNIYFCFINYVKAFDYVDHKTGTTQRDGMGREEGGGFRMGNTCKPVADSF